MLPYDELDIKLNCKNPDSIVSVSVGGRYVRGVKKAVPAEWVAEGKKQFNIWSREQFPAPTEGRCMIPQPDGTQKPCPRKKGNNRCECSKCPHHGEYEREVLAPLSLDQMIDEYGYDPITGDDSPEDQHISTVNAAEGLSAANAFLNRLTEISPKHGLAAKLMARGIKGEQFARAMRLGHEAANRIRQQIIDLAPQGITSFSQLDISSLKVNRSKQDDYYRRAAEDLPDFED